MLYQAGVGFNQNGFNLFRGDDPTPALLQALGFSYGGANCPAAGTLDFLCGSVKGQAGISATGRIFLKALAHLKRTNASATHPETAAYGFARTTIGPVSGYISSGTTAVAFYFGLHGTISQSGNNLSVPLQAFSVATLTTSIVGQSAIQCANTSCPPDTVASVKLDNWDPHAGFRLDLRSDVSIVAPAGVSGYDAEVNADFGDTLDLLAIQVLDDQGQPVPNVTLYIADENGMPVLTFPNTPPSPGATATATVTPTPTRTPTATAIVPTPTATATPVCASPPCEICDNCLDDDGDQLVDRDDTADCPSGDGQGVGLTAPRSKAAVKCQKAIEKAGAQFAAQRLDHLHACVNGELACVQAKPADDSCRAKAQARCTKELGALAKDEAKLTGTITKACGSKDPGGPPQVDPIDLRDGTGLGYAAFETDCVQRFLTGGLANSDDVAACVAREHACRVEQIVGAQVPRAYELFTRAGRNPAVELGCLPAGSNGNDQGLGQPKDRAKAAIDCEKAITKAGAKFVKSRLAIARTCTDKVFACIQLADEATCIAKAKTACAKAFAKLAAPGSGVQARLATAVVKACTDPNLAVADIVADDGLGFGALATECNALGVSPLDSPAQIAACVQRRLACRTEQLLELQVPRLRELLGIGQVAFP